MKYQYKYLHVFFYNDIKFYVPLIKGINHNPLLKPNEHFFITDKEMVYNEIKEYNNTLLIKSSHLLKYMANAKWIILHAMPFKKWQFVFLPNSICKKIIWRTWGHDIRPWNKANRPIYDLLKYLEFQMFKKKIGKIFAMGVANGVDIVNIEEVYEHKFKYFQLIYSDSSQNVDMVKNIMPTQKNIKTNILIGHNSSPVDNHLEILDKLSKFKNDNIHLVIPLSYSDPKNGYKERVIDKAYHIFGEDNVTILNDFIPKEEYIQLISKIDIAIMDMYYSNGLGNISYILYFKKKLYVKKGGNMDKCFTRAGIMPSYTSDISNQTFDEFVDNIFDNKYMYFCKGLYDKDFFQNCWKNFMEQCGE